MIVNSSILYLLEPFVSSNTHTNTYTDRQTTNGYSFICFYSFAHYLPLPPTFFSQSNLYLHVQFSSHLFTSIEVIHVKCVLSQQKWGKQPIHADCTIDGSAIFRKRRFTYLLMTLISMSVCHRFTYIHVPRMNSVHLYDYGRSGIHSFIYHAIELSCR